MDYMDNHEKSKYVEACKEPHTLRYTASIPIIKWRKQVINEGANKNYSFLDFAGFHRSSGYGNSVGLCK